MSGPSQTDPTDDRKPNGEADHDDLLSRVSRIKKDIDEVMFRSLKIRAQHFERLVNAQKENERIMDESALARENEALRGQVQQLTIENNGLRAALARSVTK
jgi:hypothetical protein